MKYCIRRVNPVQWSEPIFFDKKRDRDIEAHSLIKFYGEKIKLYTITDREYEEHLKTNEIIELVYFMGLKQTLTEMIEGKLGNTLDEIHMNLKKRLERK